MYSKHNEKVFPKQSEQIRDCSLYSNLLPAIAYKEMVKIRITLSKHIRKWVIFTTWVFKLIQTEPVYPIIFIVIVCCQPQATRGGGGKYSLLPLTRVSPFCPNLPVCALQLVICTIFLSVPYNLQCTVLCIIILPVKPFRYFVLLGYTDCVNICCSV